MAYIILTIIITLASIVSVIAVMFQQSKSYGLSAGIGGGSSSDTYFSRNKGRTKEGRLKTITIIAGIVFFVAAILLNVGLINQL